MKRWLAKRVARFMYEVVNEIAKMETDEPGSEHVVLGMADEVQAKPFGFHSNVIG